MSSDVKQLPVDLSKAQNNVKMLVCLGALRNYVKNFYKFGANILINMYGIDKGEVGHRYFANEIFSNFVGVNNVNNFKNRKFAMYMYLDFKTLACYCHYLQGLFNHLVQFKYANKNVSYLSFEKLCRTFAYYYKQKPILPIIKVNENMASKSVNDRAIMLYKNYNLISSKNVQQVFNSVLKSEFFKDPESMNLPFALDLEYLNNNNFFDKRNNSSYNSEYKMEMLEDLIDYCNVMEEKIFTQDFKNFYLEVASKLSYEINLRTEQQNLQRNDKDYVIYDEQENY